MRMSVGIPRDPTPEGRAKFGGAPVGNPLEPRPKVVEHSEPGMAPRRLRLGREDFEALGYTERSTVGGMATVKVDQGTVCAMAPQVP